MCCTPDASVWSWTSIVSFVAGAVVAIFADPVRRWIFRATLEVTFDKKTCVLHTATLITLTSRNPQSGFDSTVHYPSEGRYLRMRVGAAKRITRRAVKGCRPYLIGVELEEGGKFVPSIFVDTLRLKWSSQPEDDVAAPIDIPGDVSQFVDVLSAGKNPGATYSLHSVVPLPFYCQSLFDPAPKKLRLTILVTSDEAQSKRIHLVFNWKGTWDTFEAYPD
jgi:hypothetical protein